MKLLTAFFASLGLVLCGCAADPAPVPSPSDASLQPDVRNDAGSDAPTVNDAGACKLLKVYSSKNAVCNQCAQTKCCAEINGCFADSKCDDDYVNCILACALLDAPDGAVADDASADAGIKPCLDQCAKDQPQGKAEYDIAIGCADTKCGVECQ